MSSSPCVVLTREPEDNRPLARALAEHGVPVREIPCARTRYLDAQAPGGPFGAVAFASRRAVRGFLRAGLAVDDGCLVAAVGEATRAELDAGGLAVDLVAEPPTGRALAERLHTQLPADASVLVPRGNLAGGGLEPALAELGRPTVPLPVYTNEPGGQGAIEPFAVAAVFVAAPSAVERLLERAPWLRERPFLAIGPTTAAAARQRRVERVLGPAMSLDSQLELLVATWREQLGPSAPSPVQR